MTNLINACLDVTQIIVYLSFELTILVQFDLSLLDDLIRNIAAILNLTLCKLRELGHHSIGYVGVRLLWLSLHHFVFFC